MAVIQKRIELIGPKGRREEVALFDSGASYSCIRPEIAHAVGVVVPLGVSLDLELAEEGKTIRVTEGVSLFFMLNGYRFSDEFMLVPDLSEPIIIGAATLQKWRMKLDFERDDVIIDPRVTRLRLL